jgi:hypothetical protein
MCPLSIVVGRKRFPRKPIEYRIANGKTAYEPTPYKSAKVFTRIFGSASSKEVRGADIAVSVN